MKLSLPYGEVQLPAFFPDATYGTVRATGALDVWNTNTRGLVMNAFHLNHRPGPKTVKAMGGLHEFSGWQGAILTDSGGFQVFSMIQQNPSYGEIRPNGLIYRPDGGKEKITFTPEKCIQAQYQFGSDIMMALDHCTRPDDPDEVQRESVETTVRWAKRCKETFVQLLGDRIHETPRQLLFGIVQGGADPALRMECGQRLEEIGFDGYGFGGWPLDRDGSIRLDVLKMAADAMPDTKPKYAMGLGRPEEIVACTQMGYTLFDCVIPTREARHQRLYVFTESAADGLTPSGDFYRFLYIMDDHYRRDPRPVEEGCDCELCVNHSRAYLHHLFKVGDSLAYRLATIHNLRFYSRLMEKLR
ncbi:MULTISPECIES: tRNA guanosine(34) transglycosylase Tgt [Pseudomonadota]|uniref:Queuine tRNA-ribosyltransferase n=5 Tax=Pseudomonadota TaxID=1224 RepID=A0A0F7R0H4_PSEAI|nr:MULTISPECIES: tRNA guanosine(34) transglycosylase Tgt [Pseudomonadota]EKW7747559.1 tRNA guanosine(34) transglycosylase Tgt [Morganella morganii]HBV7026718.1 tRNA guanosine(34) transglycosylase Tgt [Escherichia coli]EJM8451545.1 tRNA guanosine(34) transglycosylase Tgt [Pseudomonas aeruginosa]EJM8451930.1 tRNA guanosine(34) transglycosylase Tgt [Pseudomonas aeruginosa]EKL0662064.1 tRNA guanosine(34) transglycosylase Tgt [Pseudomonas aeruginosa]